MGKSGVWSLVVGFATEKVAMGSPSALVKSCVAAFFAFQRRFSPARSKKKLMRPYFLPQGPEALFIASGVSRYSHMDDIKNRNQ